VRREFVLFCPRSQLLGATILLGMEIFSLTTVCVPVTPLAHELRTIGRGIDGKSLAFSHCRGCNGMHGGIHMHAFGMCKRHAQCRQRAQRRRQDRALECGERERCVRTLVPWVDEYKE